MKVLSSTQFRIQYHRLTEPTEVVALGRVIGIWTPSVITTTPVARGSEEFRPLPRIKKAK